jgi:hypothetical protein
LGSHLSRDGAVTDKNYCQQSTTPPDYVAGKISRAVVQPVATALLNLQCMFKLKSPGCKMHAALPTPESSLSYKSCKPTHNGLFKQAQPPKLCALRQHMIHALCHACIVAQWGCAGANFNSAPIMSSQGGLVKEADPST